MAVRIALQCIEVDSLLILAENNLAAKWLSRPGEAIYNDANGAPEGNHFFQVVWLPDERREDYLKQIRAMGNERGGALPRSPIVFEGDAAADLSRNPLLRQQLDLPDWPESLRSAQAWIGDPVAIKDLTSALFRRQGGNHLLIVGQNDEAAMGVTATAIVSLAAQYPPAASSSARAGARFFVLDGTPEDHPQAGVLDRFATLLPHGIKVGGWRDIAQFLAAVAGELALRQQPDASEAPEFFLFVHDLARFRDLRRREDDFGFGRKEDDLAPPDHLDMILREGPGLGVHLIAWCDTVNNLNRYFTHQQLREFEMRVLFQYEPDRLRRSARLARRQQARPQPRPLRQRGAEPAGEVPALRRAVGRVDQECRRRFAKTLAGVTDRRECEASAGHRSQRGSPGRAELGMHALRSWCCNLSRNV